MKYNCYKCGGLEVFQSANIMLPINDFEGPLKTGDEIIKDLVWEDYYYCKTCAEETSVEVTGMECEGK
tara:strand:+ start:356 stop:559 length:204 start_codon:yes stop_codon:yes gene_type:complete